MEEMKCNLWVRWFVGLGIDHHARATQDIRRTETADTEHPLSMREDRQVPSGTPFPGASKIGKPMAETKKLLNQTFTRWADAVKEIAGQGGSGG